MVSFTRSICTRQLSHGFYSAWDIYSPHAVHIPKYHETTITCISVAILRLCCSTLCIKKTFYMLKYLSIYVYISQCDIIQCV